MQTTVKFHTFVYCRKVSDHFRFLPETEIQKHGGSQEQAS
jgi:hypothetical protein